MAEAVRELCEAHSVAVVAVEVRHGRKQVRIALDVTVVNGDSVEPVGPYLHLQAGDGGTAGAVRIRAGRHLQQLVEPCATVVCRVGVGREHEQRREPEDDVPS